MAISNQTLATTEDEPIPYVYADGRTLDGQPDRLLVGGDRLLRDIRQRPLACADGSFETPSDNAAAFSVIE
ncbi:hypothetical protein [Massilia sp. TWR1-2-2]|uniref:hypothetical protein n=1 Tax=Massilia sp. TWR1-2-2 TaxID=2804584 RepID=UPI003CEB5487